MESKMQETHSYMSSPQKKAMTMEQIGNRMKEYFKEKLRQEMRERMMQA